MSETTKKNGLSAVNWKRFTVIALIGAVANLAVFDAGSLAGATWIANGQTLGWYMVVFASLFPLFVAALVTALLAKKWSHAITVFSWVGLVFGVITAPTTFFATADTVSAVSLAFMHVIAGVTWFVGIRSTKN